MALLGLVITESYVGMEPQHLDAYVNEQAFRFYHFREADWTRFDRLMARVTGKQLA